MTAHSGLDFVLTVLRQVNSPAELRTTNRKVKNSTCYKHTQETLKENFSFDVLLFFKIILQLDKILDSA